MGSLSLFERCPRPPQAPLRERAQSVRHRRHRSKRAKLPTSSGLSFYSMKLQYGFISVDDHVQEPPDLWSKRLSKSRWGERIPHIESANGAEHWIVDGNVLLEGGPARVAGLMEDRNHEPKRWEEVPPAAYRPNERLKDMDARSEEHTSELQSH